MLIPCLQFRGGTLVQSREERVLTQETFLPSQDQPRLQKKPANHPRKWQQALSILLWTMVHCEPWCVFPALYFCKLVLQRSTKGEGNTVLDNRRKLMKALSPLAPLPVISVIQWMRLGVWSSSEKAKSRSYIFRFPLQPPHQAHFIKRTSWAIGLALLVVLLSPFSFSATGRKHVSPLTDITDISAMLIRASKLRSGSSYFKALIAHKGKQSVPGVRKNSKSGHENGCKSGGCCTRNWCNSSDL